MKRFRARSGSYEIATSDDAATGLREWKVVRADPLPSSLSLSAGDVIHNLRSALDHLIYQLVIANGGKPDTSTAFPLWRTKALYMANRPGSAKGISEAAFDVLHGLRPYKRGNPSLWALHRLDIIDKHRLLLAVAEAHRNTVIDLGPTLEAQGAFGIPPPPIVIHSTRKRVNVGTVLLRWAPIDDVDFSFGIALDEPEAGKREPLLPTLEDLVAIVDGVIELFSPLF
jgi:hypothetical protein